MTQLIQDSKKIAVMIFFVQLIPQIKFF